MFQHALCFLNVYLSLILDCPNKNNTEKYRTYLTGSVCYLHQFLQQIWTRYHDKRRFINYPLKTALTVGRSQETAFPALFVPVICWSKINFQILGELFETFNNEHKTFSFCINPKSFLIKCFQILILFQVISIWLITDDTTNDHNFLVLF